jgi:hypothetical protein
LSKRQAATTAQIVKKTSTIYQELSYLCSVNRMPHYLTKLNKYFSTISLELIQFHPIYKRTISE